jgi:CobQ-like glutamine amidotransferase family enzyme
VKLVAGHLFPDYLNIYADRGNIAVLTQRAAWRGHELEVRPLGAGHAMRPGEYDLFYVETWSLAFDIKILLKTLAAVIRDRNAY